MLKHIVLFRKKTDVNREQAVEDNLVHQMSELGSKIPVILDWQVSKNEIDRPICWDYSLEAVVESTDALTNYLNHPLHVQLVERLKQYFEWAAVDFHFDETVSKSQITH